MKPPTRAPVYACMYPGLCDVARKLGYALAIHGTVTSDLDLIACPWTEEAVSPEVLKDALMKHIAACGYDDLLRRDCPHLTEEHIAQIVAVNDSGCVSGGTKKPHGRLAWNLYLYAGSKVDLSIMPRIFKNEVLQTGASTGATGVSQV